MCSRKLEIKSWRSGERVKLEKGIFRIKTIVIVCVVAGGSYTCGDHDIMYWLIESLCCASETNGTVRVNYNLKNEPTRWWWTLAWRRMHRKGHSQRKNLRTGPGDHQCVKKLRMESCEWRNWKRKHDGNPLPWQLIWFLKGLLTAFTSLKAESVGKLTGVGWRRRESVDT